MSNTVVSAPLNFGRNEQQTQMDMHAYIHTYIHTYLCTYVQYMHLHACMHTCTYIHVHKYTSKHSQFEEHFQPSHKQRTEPKIGKHTLTKAKTLRITIVVMYRCVRGQLLSGKNLRKGLNSYILDFLKEAIIHKAGIYYVCMYTLNNASIE